MLYSYATWRAMIASPAPRTGSRQVPRVPRTDFVENPESVEYLEFLDSGLDCGCDPPKPRIDSGLDCGCDPTTPVAPLFDSLDATRWIPGSGGGAS
eukprot:scaffold12331_cov56-Phaeocystis_antarctica.AAC.5